MLNFVLPGYYLYITRLKSTWALLSWCIVYPITAGLGAFYSVDGFLCSHVIVYIVAFMTCLSVYEIGYIANDCAAVYGELGGTQRAGPKTVVVITRYYYEIAMCKGVLSIGLCAFTSVIASFLGVTITISRFAGALIAMYLAFLVHNYVRSRWSIATFMALCCLKYFTFIFLFPQRTVRAIVTLMITEGVLTPLLRTIEYSTKNRFHVTWSNALVGNIDWFRVEYFSVVVGICAVLCAMQQSWARLLLVSSTFMLLYRIMTLVLLVRSDLRNKEMVGVRISGHEGAS